MQNLKKKITIIQNEDDTMQHIGKILANTEGCEVEYISQNNAAILEAINDVNTSFVICDLKSNANLLPYLPHEPLSKDILTLREQEILDLLSKGFLYKKIAQSMEVTVGTLKQYVHIIYGKLGVSNKIEALNKYYSWCRPNKS